VYLLIFENIRDMIDSLFTRTRRLMHLFKCLPESASLSTISKAEAE